MNSPRYRGKFLLALLIAGVIGSAMIIRLSTQRQYSVMTPTLQKHAASPLDVIDPFKVAHNSTETHCVTAKVENNTFPVCTYSAEDDPIVSANIQKGAYWQPNEVTIMLQLLRLHSTATSKAGFVDIGANVGAFTLAAAHSGHHVIALEPNMMTMRHLAASVVNGNVQERIVLLNNAATNVTGSNLHLMTDTKNRGDTRVVANVTCELGADVMAECRHEGQIVRTIRLNDLLSLRPTTETWRLIMKVDAQGSEVAIFDPSACSRFLDEVDVMVIQVEWVWVKELYVNDEQVAVVNKMLENLYDRGYQVHDASDMEKKLSERDWRRWPYDVSFKKAI